MAMISRNTTYRRLKDKYFLIKKYYEILSCEDNQPLFLPFEKKMFLLIEPWTVLKSLWRSRLFGNKDLQQKC